MAVQNIEVGKVYEDRKGRKWRITSVTNRTVPGAPILGERWEGKHYKTRLFLRNGNYWENEEGAMDLVREVTNDQRL